MKGHGPSSGSHMLHGTVKKKKKKKLEKGISYFRKSSDVDKGSLTTFHNDLIVFM